MDIVFTYVDFEDENWHKQKQKDCKIKSQYNNQHNSNLNEIKYAVKSIEKYFKQHRNIYFVTNNGKLPKCLPIKKNYKSILYSDLVGNRTYNSCSIETSLHKINGLSEYYIYFNDDTLLAKPTTINDFIDEKSGKLIWYEESNFFIRLANKLPIITRLYDFGDSGCNESRNRLYKKLGLRSKPNPIAHCPKIFKKSMVEEFCEKFHKEVEQQKHRLLRSSNDFPFVDAFCFYYLKKNKLLYSNKYETLILCQMDNNWISRIYNQKVSKTDKFICIEDRRKKFNIDKNVKKIISSHFKIS